MYMFLTPGWLIAWAIILPLVGFLGGLIIGARHSERAKRLSFARGRSTANDALALRMREVRNRLELEKKMAVEEARHDGYVLGYAARGTQKNVLGS